MALRQRRHPATRPVRGPKDFAKYQGKSFSLIVVDEAGQDASPGLLDLLRSCLRAPAPIKPPFILAASPGGCGHAWLCKRHVFKGTPWTIYTDETSDHLLINVPLTFVDNLNLDREAYAKQLEAATSPHAELGKAWLYGDWLIAHGAFFSTMLDERHVLLEAWEPKSLPHAQRARGGTMYAGRWDLFLAHDFGVSAPSVTYVCAESPGAEGPDGRYYPRGSIVLLDELATAEPGTIGRGMGYPIPKLTATLGSSGNVAA